MHTNFYPLELPFDSFQVQRVETSQGLLDELRDDHNETHSFFNQGKYTYISPMQGESLDIGEIATLELQDNTRVASSLIKHIFFRTFRERFDIVPLSFYPFQILSRRQEDDMLSGVLPDPVSETLSRKQRIEIHLRDIEAEGELLFGMLVNLRYRWVFDANCAELIEEGFDPTGMEVLRSQPLPGLEGILAPDETLVGPIASVNGDSAVVDTNEGPKSHSLSTLFLHKSPDNIEEYLQFKLGRQKTKRVFKHIRENNEIRTNAAYYYNKTRRVANRLSQLNYRNDDNFTFSISGKPLSTKDKFRISGPTFIFDYTPGASSDSATEGLIEYGPFDSTTFSPNDLNILVLCHKSNRGGFSDFCGKIRDGISSSLYFKGGMTGKYHLHKINFRILELHDYSLDEYARVVKEHMRGGEFYPDLVIGETKEEFKDYAPNLSPYYRTKAYFLQQGIPVQFVKNENVRKPDKYLKYICDSLCLQMYAKIGGTPWVLPASSKVDHEFVVGIGHTLFRSNKYAGNDQSRVVGITTFFKGDGMYLFGDQCREVPYEDYFDELLRDLRSSINDLSEEYAWKSNDVIRIVFHVFKPMKNIEADVVNDLIDEFPEYNIKFSFVTVSERHPYLMFDKNEKGISYQRSGESVNKGRYIPARRSNWILNAHECLVQMKGPDDIKSHTHGFSNPIKIEIHEGSTFTDLNYIAQQVCNFTHLAWRGFFHVQRPVTLLYSKWIAELLANLKEIDHWQPEAVASPDLKGKKWFL